MKAFEFRDYHAQITIAGNSFDIDTSTETGDKVRRCTIAEKNLANEVAEGNKTNDELLEKFMGDLDSILGSGASKKIFAYRIPTVSDASDVMLYIVDYLIECNAERQADRAGRRQVIDVVKNG